MTTFPNKTKVLLCDRFALSAQIKLKQNPLFHVEQLATDYSKEGLAQQLSVAQALVIRSKFRVDASVLEQTPQLQVIITCTSGFDHIDLEETTRKNITVMYTPDANSAAAAELTWALLLACSRQVVAANKEMKAGRWQRDPFFSFELAEKTLGIVGLGRVGGKVAQLAKAFGMQVLAFDPYQTDAVFSSHQATRLSFDELLKQSDIVTFHVPATSETRHLLNRTTIDSLHENSIVINTSRGNVICEETLASALLDRRIKCAGLDVFSKEPLPRDSKLLKCANLVMTPHLGAYTEEALTKASLQAVFLLENFFEKNESQDTLPLQNDWGSLSFNDP